MKLIYWYVYLYQVADLEGGGQSGRCSRQCMGKTLINGTFMQICFWCCHFVKRERIPQRIFVCFVSKELNTILSELLVKPIFHQAFSGRVGEDNGIFFALGTFQQFFSPPKNKCLKRIGITMNQDIHFTFIGLKCQYKTTTTLSGI